MNTERLLRLKSQTQSLRGSDLLLGDNARLDGLLRAYLIACRVEGKSPATLNVYRDDVSAFIEFLKEEELPLEAAAVEPTFVRLFLLSIQEREVTPETVNAYYRGVNTFFNWLVREGCLAKSPLDNIKPPRIPEKIIQPYTNYDINRLLLLCEGTRFVDIRNRAIILTFLDTGLRLFELADVKLDDIDFSKETIKVMGKGGKERIVPI